MTSEVDRIVLQAAWADIAFRDGATVSECRGVPLYRPDPERFAGAPVLLFRGMSAMGSVVEVFVGEDGLTVEANGLQCWPPEVAA